MTVEVFAVSGLLPTQAELDGLKADFKNWKETGYLPAYFGRDADFSIHSGARLAELRHLHLAQTGTWHPRQRQNGRTSDRWLIYCAGLYDPDKYLLIAILEPDAHRQARKGFILDGLVNYADDFRNRF